MPINNQHTKLDFTLTVPSWLVVEGKQFVDSRVPKKVDPMISFKQAALAFHSNDCVLGMKYWCEGIKYCSGSEQKEVLGAVFKNVWMIKNCPMGNPEFGRDSFYSLSGEHASNNEERAKAIEIYLVSKFVTVPLALTTFNKVTLDIRERAKADGTGNFEHIVEFLKKVDLRVIPPDMYDRAIEPAIKSTSQIFAKYVLELIITPIPEPATRLAVKEAIMTLYQHLYHPYVEPIVYQKLREILVKPDSALVAITAQS